MAKQEPLDLVTSAEAARILGWKRQQVAEYVKRGWFPLPINRVEEGRRARRMWLRETIEEYKKERARKRGENA
jgi:predicted DNA-binding transcriptional regulator AlpA